MTNSKNTQKVVSEAEFLDFLRAAVEACGGLVAVARASTLDKANISKAVRVKRRQGPMLLKALDICEE
jgi:DNA-binding phage protein